MQPLLKTFADKFLIVFITWGHLGLVKKTSKKLMLLVNVMQNK